jgi:hypothetical protein
MVPSEHNGDALVKAEITFQFPDERAVYFFVDKTNIRTYFPTVK